MTSDGQPRRGIVAGGNWIVDRVKLIDGWPPQDALANIISESWGNGGAPYNVLKNLFKLGAEFPLFGIGLVGDDANAALILDDCRRHGIDVGQLRIQAGSSTSYTDVMTVKSTGRRTFFHQRGANALLDVHHFDFSRTAAKIFHLGYLLLLDRLDEPEPGDDGRPRAAAVLQAARRAGLLTSLDCVSENGDRFREVAAPVLPEVDILFVNDFEAEKLTGITLRGADDGTIRRRFVERAAAALQKLGARRWVIIHFPEAAYALGSRGEEYWQPSLAVPSRLIKGTAGAGDAFAAGVLFGLHDDWPIADALRLGVSAGAASLTDPTCSQGLISWIQCLKLPATLGWQPLAEA